MAIRDVKEYYLTMLAQAVEAKEDLADFEQAVRDGNITEARLQEVKDDINQIQINVDRLGYIIYLLELPKRKGKQPKFNKTYKELLDKFKSANATRDCVEDENDSLLNLLHQALEKLTEKE
jgi:hypothetical protein